MRRRTDLLAVALVTLAVLLFWADVLAGGRSLYVRDIARTYVPDRAVLGSLLRSGELPLWNPHYAAGQPFAANPAYETFYPPQWLAALPDAVQAVSLEVVFHLLLAGLGMFAFLRSLELRVEAAVFGALTLALGGLMLSTANLFPFLFSLAWWPWIALFLRREQFALGALALGAMLLVAEQTMILQAAAVLTIYAATRRGFRGAITAAAMGAGAFLVGAVQLIPALDFVRDTGRAKPFTLAEASAWSMAPLRPLELFLPSAFGHPTPDALYFWNVQHPSGAPLIFSWYAGLLAAALIVAGFVHRIRGWAFTAAVAAGSYAFAVTPLHYFLGLHSVRYPEKFFIAGAFVLLVFAALAAHEFIEDPRFRRTTFAASLGLAALSAAWLAFAWSPLLPRAFGLRGYIDDTLAEARAGALTMLVTAIALALILVFRDRPRLLIPLLILFVLADLGGRTYGLAPRIDRSFYDRPEIARDLPAGARLYNDAAWRIALLPQPRIAYQNRWPRMRNGLFPELPSLWGFDSVLEVDVNNTMLLATQELSAAFWRAQFSGQNDVVRRMLFDAGATHVVALRDATSPDHPADVVTLPGATRWQLDGRGQIVRAQQSANRLRFAVEAAQPARLVVSVTRHRYWNATIDGAAAAIHPANIAFQSIDVPAGRHIVAMEYRNPLVIACAFVSLFSALGLAAAALRSKAPRLPSPR